MKKLYQNLLRCFLYTASMLFIFSTTGYGQNCPPGALTSNRTNKLYLYFPTVSDATFPEYNADAQTSPLEPFNVADLGAGIGTTAQLRNRIFQIVTEDYCEFNVEVISTTTAPSPVAPRWQIVGIGTDDENVFGGALFGVAQDVDLNDADAQDYARVYARSFLNAYGGAGDALNGANSTLERWATAIGSTTSHEAAHNYGLSHGNSAPRPGEDAQNNHILATGSTGLTGEGRAGNRRHFSDQSYEILAHNIGLNVKTLYNWDFQNPNDQSAHSMVITVLSTAPSLSINWFYNGGLSPWTNPTIAPTGGTQTFQGVVYNVYNITFSVPKAWNNGPNGIAPAGVDFHTGVTFNEPNPVIVYDTRLFGSTNNQLSLHPRMIGLDLGDFDLASGDFRINAFNFDPANPLLIQNLRIQFLPRVASIESMVRGDTLRDHRGQIIRPHGFFFDDRQRIPIREQIEIPIANLQGKRYVDITYDSTDCGNQGPGDSDSLEVPYCFSGTALSLFPSTTVYITADIVDPNATYFDPTTNSFVTGPLTTRVFYQVAGIVPDFNRNGIDDLIDIRTGVSVDENNNGIPDEGELTNQIVGGVRCPGNVSQGCEFPVRVNIDMRNAATPDTLLGSFTGTLSWNPAQVSYVGPTTVLSGYNGFVRVDSLNGQLVFNGANSAGREGIVAVLQSYFRAVGPVNTSAAVQVSFTAMAAANSFNDLTPLLRITDSCIANINAAGLLGDVNNDGRVNSTDALIILSYDAGLPIPSIPSNRIGGYFGDVNNDLLTNATDALIILTYDAGYPVPYPIGQVFCPRTGLAVNPMAAMRTAESGSVLVQATLNDYVEGSVVEIPVNVDMSLTDKELGSFTANVSWNTANLQYLGLEGGSTTGFNSPVVNENGVSNGILKFTNANPEGADGIVNIAKLKFKVLKTLKNDDLKISMSSLAAAHTFDNLLSGHAVEVDLQGLVTGVTGAGAIDRIVDVFPNPFSETTNIVYNINKPATVQIDIYNSMGVFIERILEEQQSAGTHTAIWNATDQLASGVYILKIKTGDSMIQEKVILK